MLTMPVHAQGGSPVLSSSGRKPCAAAHQHLLQPALEEVSDLSQGFRGHRDGLQLCSRLYSCCQVQRHSPGDQDLQAKGFRS